MENLEVIDPIEEEDEKEIFIAENQNNITLNMHKATSIRRI